MTTTTHRFQPGTRVWTGTELGTVLGDTAPTGLGEPRVLVHIPDTGRIPLRVDSLRIPMHLLWSVAYRYDVNDAPTNALTTVAADTAEQAAEQVRRDLGGILPGFALTGRVDLQPPGLLSW